MNATPDDCIHLTVDIVKEIHEAVIAEFGGMRGVRDEGLLASAVAAPRAAFGGKSPFADLVEVAAAYLYYICRNHAFHDGDKRAAMAAAIVFLRLNGIEPSPDSDQWEALVLDVGASRIDREQATIRLRRVIPSFRRRTARKKK